MVTAVNCLKVVSFYNVAFTEENINSGSCNTTYSFVTDYN